MNELELSNDLQIIETEINWHKDNAGQSIWEIGRRLNHVKEHDLTHGEFMDWVAKQDIEQTAANRMMKIAEELPKSATLHNLGTSALYLISTLPEGEKQAELSKAEEGEPSTIRELKELKKQLKEKDEKIKRLDQVNLELATENEKSAHPRIIEKEIVKEVIPDDYEDLKNKSKRMEMLIRSNESLEKEISDLESRLSQQDENSRKYEELNRKIKEMNGRLTEGQKRIQVQKDIYRFAEESNQAISKLSALIYLVDEKEMSINEYAREPIEKIVSDLEDICNRLNQKISQSNIIEGEFTHG